MDFLFDTNKRSIAFRALLVGTLVVLWGTCSHAAGLLVADGGFGGVLEIQEHTARVTINNGIAVTEVNQVFLNTEKRQVEAQYTFPVPAGASVANFSMWINGKEMVGEVVEKERARKIYESYKRKRRDPGLLEQVDFRTFEMRIFPIAAGAEQRVQITYYQELDHDNDWATYVYPLATSTRPQLDSRVKGKFGLTLEVKSEIPIVEMDSPSHDADFVYTAHDESFYEASLETTGGNLGRDIVLAYHLSRPRTGVDIITSRSDGEDGYFCMTITAGEELAGAVTGMDYVFVLDISGSMNSDRKLDTSARAVQSFLETLGEQDRFEVMAFNVKPTVLFSQLTAVDADALGKAAGFLGQQQARGGTELQPAMSTAYKYAEPSGDRTLNVVILSDGLTEQGDRAELLQLIQTRPQNARVFCIGVGNNVNRGLLEQMAEDAGGLAALVSRGDNFERQAKAFRRKLTHPVATDLAIAFGGVDVYDVVPERLPNLYHGTPVRLYGRYRGAGTAQVGISANLMGQGFDQSVDLAFPDTDPDNPEIERMWAWHRVQRLLKDADRTGSRASVVEEIVRLGEGYSIASEYTSFLVLENNAEYDRWKIKRRNALRIDRDRKAQAKLRAELDALRQAAADKLGPAGPAEKVETAKKPAPRPGVNNATPPRASKPRPQVARRTPSKQSRDFNLPSLPGGGAIDPISGGIALSLAGMATAAWRKKRK